MEEDEVELLERIEQRQKDYYRLSIQVAKVTAILVPGSYPETGCLEDEWALPELR